MPKSHSEPRTTQVTPEPALEKRTRRQFTPEYKLRILAEADAWQRACEQAEISDFRWHDLRRTWASWHVQNGTSLQELMELGGWKSYKMVLRYAHLAGDHLRGAAGNITNSLRCAAQPEAPTKEANR